jgi:predicted Zn-dependent protease
VKFAWAATMLFSLLGGCSSPPPPRVLSVSEQIAEDNQSALSLQLQFEKKMSYVTLPEWERFLTEIARKLGRVQEGLPVQTIRVKIHRDSSPGHSKWFSFPGTTISVPWSQLQIVEYENEIAAGLAFELSNVIKRHLAQKIQRGKVNLMLGEGSVFELDREEREASIQLGTRMLYYAGYDLRGMASVFQRYPEFFSGLSSKKEVEFNVKESQRTRSDYLPVRDPVVRSAEFVRLKKRLKP